jgi:O-antigen/teichoic acid export membrane protein
VTSLRITGFQSSQISLLSGLGVSGAAFGIARLLQLGSTIWLSRVLSPTDFGVLAVIFAVQSFAAQVTSFNLGSELIRSAKLDPHDVDVAWSYEFVRNVALWAMVFFPADLYAGLLNMPESAGAMRVASFGFIFSAFRNPYLIRIRRDKLFVLLGIMDVIPAIVLAIGSIMLVWLSGHYIGVVYAGLASLLASTFCSYLAFPALPRFRFSIRRAAPMFSFGGKLFGAGVVSALESNFPVFLLATAGYAEDVGYFSRAWALSMALALSSTVIIWRVCYPHFAQTFVAGASPLPQAFRTCGYLLALGLGGAVIASFFAKGIIGLLLGPQWLEICNVWSLLLFAGALNVAASPLACALQATRYETQQFALFSCSAFFGICFYFVLYISLGFFGLGLAALFSSIILIIGYIAFSRRVLRRCR